MLGTATSLAALLVIVAGCGGSVGEGGTGDEVTPPAAAFPTASESPVSTPAPALPGPVAWVGSLPVGEPPAMGYVIGHRFHTADGRLIRLPRDRGVTAITRLGDGFLAVDDRTFEGTTGLDRLDARGRRVAELGTVAGAPVLSADGTTLRWITFTPPEVSPSERRPTRLHVADVATGEIRSRVVRRNVDALPAVPQRERVPGVVTRRDELVVVDDATGEQELGRLPSPGPWTRRGLWSAAREDRRHLLVAVVSGRGGERAAAIVRFDLRTGTAELAVDWLPTEGVYHVAFETQP